MKLILSRYVLLAFVNTVICNNLGMRRNVGGMYIPEHDCHISALTDARSFILSNNALL